MSEGPRSPLVKMEYLEKQTSPPFSSSHVSPLHGTKGWCEVKWSSLSMERGSEVWSTARQSDGHFWEIVSFQWGAKVLGTWKERRPAGNRSENGAAGSRDLQAASQQFLSPQSTNQLVHNPLRNSVGHTQGGPICNAGKHLTGGQHSDKTERHLVFLRGSRVFPSLLCD